MHSALRLLVCLLPGAIAGAAEQNVQHGLRVTGGFEVTEYADAKWANDIFSIAIDARGRVAVSGRGYVRILVDDDDDGRCDRSIPFSEGPSDGAQGLLFEDDSLFVVGDGGLRRYRDENGDGRADGPSELIRAIKTGGEHDAHDIKRGPDGWLYVLCGNMAGIDGSFAQLSTSPIKDPVAGCVIRFSPDLKTTEIVADGFRNAYRMDWSLRGELFTYDSDNERCVSLPWYETTRFYHVLSGGNHGWLSPQRAQWFRLPPYYLDVVAPVAYLGRGSPTGVACYRHVQFPEKYHGGFFLADWTFGRIWFVRLAENGSSFRGDAEVFLESIGENGFAPTDIAVHPISGDLFIAIGGRGTRGAIYRVRSVGKRPSRPAPDAATFQIPPQSLSWDGARASLQYERVTSEDLYARRHALEFVSRHASRYAVDQRLVAVRQNWTQPDRQIRQATSGLMRTLPASTLQRLSSETNSPEATSTFGLAAYDSMPEEVVTAAIGLIETGRANHALDGVRLLQLAWGGLVSPDSRGTIWEAYTLHRPLNPSAATVHRAITALCNAVPSTDARLMRELARTLAIVESNDASLYARFARSITEESDPADDIHYLAAMARLRGEPDANFSRSVAHMLVRLDRRLDERSMSRDRHWPLRVAELHGELARRLPSLNQELLADREFGRTEHILFAQAKGFDRARAAALFRDRAKREKDLHWTPALVDLIGSLPAEESISLLRQQWDKVALRDSIVGILSRKPREPDRGLFLEGLQSAQLETVSACITALEQIHTPYDGHQLIPLVRALRRLRDGKEELRLRERVGRLLQSVTGEPIEANDAAAWTAWFERTHRDFASRLGEMDGVDITMWTERLARIEWSDGDTENGRRVFTRSCLACHSGARAMGPDLRGAAHRFSRDDLFTAIIQPSRDVSPRYQTTLVATVDGKVYQGTIIYEAVDSLILQTGADSTIRITDNQIIEKRTTSNSLMPAGMLDPMSDAEIADLYAYLRSQR